MGALYIVLRLQAEKQYRYKKTALGPLHDGPGPSSVRLTLHDRLLFTPFAPARPKAQLVTRQQEPESVPSHPKSSPSLSALPEYATAQAPRERRPGDRSRGRVLARRRHFFCPAGPMRTTTRGAVLDDGNVTERSYGPDFRSLGMIMGEASARL